MSDSARRRFRSTIHDRHDVAYTLRCDIDDTLWRMDVLDGIVTVGNVFALPADDTLLLQNISLHREVLFHESSMIHFMRRIFRHPRRPKDYRFRGLGVVLLHRVIELARHYGFSRITGKVTADDFQRYARLPDWYRRQGFLVEETGTPKEPFTLSYEL